MKSKSSAGPAWLALALFVILGNRAAIGAAESFTPFDGEKSAWHDGFDRYDYVMDEATLAIVPLKAPEGEKFGVRDPAKSQRRMPALRSRRGRMSMRNSFGDGAAARFWLAPNEFQPRYRRLGLTVLFQKN